MTGRRPGPVDGGGPAAVAAAVLGPIVPPPPVVRSDAAVRRAVGCLSAGLLLIGASAVAMVVLHVVPPGSHLDPLSRTISEYALLPVGWLFDTGVAALALGSAGILAGLVLLGLVRPLSTAGVMTATWCLGLIGLIVFPKQGFGSDPSVAGRVHWTWTLIAFFALPIGAVAACRGRDTRLTRWVLGLCWFAAAWFGALTVQTVLGRVTHWHLWSVVGLVERVLSAAEIAAVVIMGCWGLADAGLVRRGPGPADLVGEGDRPGAGDPPGGRESSGRGGPAGRTGTGRGGSAAAGVEGPVPADAAR